MNNNLKSLLAIIIVGLAAFWVFTYEKTEIQYTTSSATVENYNVNDNQNINVVTTGVETGSTTRSMGMTIVACNTTNDVIALFNRLSVFQQMYAKVVAVDGIFAVYFLVPTTPGKTNRTSVTNVRTQTATTNRSGITGLFGIKFPAP